MKRLNAMGTGPRIAIVLLPWLALTIFLSVFYRPLFNLTSGKNNYITLAGYLFLITGLVFYLATVRFLLKGLKETRLMTGGPYAVCQNPLYSSLILFIVPAVSLLVNSWLILTSCPVGYILFKLSIKTEYAELEKFFGQEYHDYRQRTPEFFPFLKI
jgi:protein-S-isoprenylcysteine O-methyltransferase Ste14